MSTPQSIRNARAFWADQERFDNMAPPDLDDDDLRSVQKLGDATVEVSYCAPHGYVSINGAYIGGEFVDDFEFSVRCIDAWRSAIQRDLDSYKANALDEEEA